MRKSYVKFVEIFSQNGLLDIELDDLFSEIRMLQKTLPHADVLMRAIEIFEFVIDIDYFSNILTNYQFLYYTSDS